MEQLKFVIASCTVIAHLCTNSWYHARRRHRPADSPPGPCWCTPFNQGFSLSACMPLVILFERGPHVLKSALTRYCVARVFSFRRWRLVHASISEKTLGVLRRPRDRPVSGPERKMLKVFFSRNMHACGRWPAKDYFILAASTSCLRMLASCIRAHELYWLSRQYRLL